jgi:hypothetical protein
MARHRASSLVLVAFPLSALALLLTAAATCAHPRPVPSNTHRLRVRRLRAALALSGGLALAVLAGCGVTPAGDVAALGPGATATSAARDTATRTADPAAGTAGAVGTIAGDVVAGPTCPVERAEDPCPPRPVPDRLVTIVRPAGTTTQAGIVVGTTKTDASGHFSVTAAPGKYVVQVLAGPGMLGLRQETPGDVTVTANQVSTVHILLDTGIR